MEPHLIVRALKATTSPGDQSEAADYLKKCSAVGGFTLILAEILRDKSQEVSVRQASVIYLKNTIARAWVVSDLDAENLTQINEHDKAVLRSQIVDLIVESPEAIRVQLCNCIQTMLQKDFPDSWITQTGTAIVGDILGLLRSNQGEKYLAGLLITHRLAKTFEYGRLSEKQLFIRAMQQILPVTYRLFDQLLPINNRESCQLQKQIFKIFYSLTRFSLSPDLLTFEEFRGWFNVFIAVIEREVPTEIDQLDNYEKENSIYWKCKKWAMKIVHHVFVGYGSKNHVEKKYESFSIFYTDNLAPQAVLTAMRTLSQHASGVYISDRVLHICISHLAEALTHAKVWKAVKDHLLPMFTNVLFPLMMHTDEDEDMWSEEPEVYLRQKADYWEERYSLASAAVKFIVAATKRKGVLHLILSFALGKLGKSETSIRDVDAALHVIASLAEFLCGDKRYKNSVEGLLFQHVYPRITSLDRFIRAQALRVFSEAASAPFKDHGFLSALTSSILQRLVDSNEELPVKFEAAMALTSLISDQPKVHPFVKPRIQEILTGVLDLLVCLKLDDLPHTVEVIIEHFEEDVIPFTNLVVSQLVVAFYSLTKPEDNDFDENGMTAMGVLSTLQTVLGLVDERAQIADSIEPVVRELIVHILDAHASDFFDECSGLIENLIAIKVSPEMWNIFDKLCLAFDVEKSLFLSDALPSFYKFVTVGTDAFLANPNRVQKLLSMCSQVMQDTECGDIVRAGAVKMIEVVITQCQGRLDAYFPDIMMLLVQYFAQPNKDFELLEAQLAVTLASAFVCSPQQFLSAIVNLDPHRENNLAWLFERLFQLYKKFDGIHNCVMTLHACILAIRLPIGDRPPRLNQSQKTLALFMELFNQIKRCRIAIAKENEPEDSESSDDEDDVNNSKRNIDLDLNDSDDDLDEGCHGYLSRLSRLGEDSDLEGSDGLHSFIEKTEFEDYETLFDREDANVNVYDQFLNLLKDLEQNEPQYYRSLIDSVPEEKKREFEELIALCRREQMHYQSRQVAQSGGFSFDVDVIGPNAFNFNR